MSDAALAGVPRIVRAAEETRMRGSLAIALAVAVAGWWLTQWVLDQYLRLGRGVAIACIVAVLAGHLAWINSRRRVRIGLESPRRPTPAVVFETRADAGSRRARFSGAVFLTVIVILAIDMLASWGGVTAGVIVGVAVGAGLADLWESRSWRRAEDERDSRLYLYVEADALVAAYGTPTVFEEALEDDHRADVQ